MHFNYIESSGILCVAKVQKLVLNISFTQAVTWVLWYLMNISSYYLKARFNEKSFSFGIVDDVCLSSNITMFAINASLLLEWTEKNVILFHIFLLSSSKWTRPLRRWDKEDREINESQNRCRAKEIWLAIPPSLNAVEN